MAAPSEDDDDDFVSIGTALQPLDDELTRRKPQNVQDQTVRDEQGRQRFHGAFTGGFSAGYFNTVGSETGWTPSTFVSSRNKRSENVSQQPEDYMDAEDLGQFGIAPRKIVTTDKFAGDERNKERKRRLGEFSSGIAGYLDDLIKPTKLTVGVKLLTKQGWKQGQGVGPKLKKQLPSANAVSQKMYGCALPPTPDDGEIDHNVLGLMFAPKDITPFSFNQKNDRHGIGYHGIDPQTAISGGHVNLFEPAPPIKRTGRKGIRGQAFGTGALNDEDADIYGTDSLANYDMCLDDEKDVNRSNHGWTAPVHLAITNAPSKNEVLALSGFSGATKPPPRQKTFYPCKIPKDYKPIHVFTTQNTPLIAGIQSDVKVMDPLTRAIALGEKTGSVFELISKSEKERIEKVKQVGARTSVDEYVSPHKPQESSSVPVAMKQTPPEKSAPLFKPGQITFKPFAKNPEKQERYEKYLQVRQQGKTYGDDEIPEGSMTEWERDQEKEEFARAAKLYKPMSNFMASRFTAAKYEDDADKVEVPAEQGGDKSDQMKAAKMKMFGHMTRDHFEWHPDRLLCKRFNIANPYPQSSLTGLPKVKRDKFSVFNFLNSPANEEPSKQPGFLADETSSRPKISFSIGASKKSDESTTAHFDSVSKDTTSETSSNDLAQPSVDEPASSTPSTDLFQAIFASTDSESSDEENTETSPDKSNKSDTSSAVCMDVKSDSMMEIEETDNSSDLMNTKAISVNTVVQPEDEEAKTPRKKTSRFNLFEPFLQQANTNTPTTSQPLTSVTASTPSINDLKDRLSPLLPDQDDSFLKYGPALPPSSSSRINISSDSDKDVQPNNSRAQYSEASASSHRKQKHKHKEKKKKHKKEKKKKKKVKKKKRTDMSSSSDGESSDDADDEGSSTDARLLSMLTGLSAGKRMTAADFM
ncbi:G patch domain-containing protein 1-like [Tubulanus polymorphus]|uniref:G patch domain-containing protein 1-like n=1 Tax=Tubulanus polymorphus TaxID=672921 RepID=UPI003DA3CB7D